MPLPFWIYRCLVWLALIGLPLVGCTQINSNSSSERLSPPLLEDQLPVETVLGHGMDLTILSNLMVSAEEDPHRDLNSILVAKNGKLILEAYFHGKERETLHDLRSVGKSVTSTLVGIALYQGAIENLDRAILDYFPEYLPLKTPDPRKSRVRIRDLLTMRSGFDADDDSDKSPGQEKRMLRTNDWVRYALNVPMASEPDLRWNYAGMNSLLLGCIVEAATKTPLEAYLERSLLQPLGIQNYRWRKTPQGRAAGQGFLSLRPRDALKFGLLFLNKGCWQGQQVVPPSWVAKATRRYTPLGYSSNSGYGYQWWISSAMVNRQRYNFYFASGNGGQKIYILPQEEMVVVITSSAYGTRRGQQRSLDVLRTILSALPKQ